MEWSTYTQLAMRTANHDLPAIERLQNSVMGLWDESGEVIGLFKKHWHQGHSLDVTKVVEECGDILWYVAQGCDALAQIDSSLIVVPNPPNYRFQDDTQQNIDSAFNWMARDVAEIYMAYWRHRYGASLRYVKKKFGPRYDGIVHSVSNILLDVGSTLDECQQANIAKLEARYGGQFSAAASIARVDVEA